MSIVADLRISCVIARRELRGGFEGAVVLLACLALGVAAIAAVGLVEAAVRDAIARDARVLMGGDVELQSPGRPLEEELLQAVVPQGATLTREIDLDSTAAANGARVAVVLRVVDDTFPLLGQVRLDPPLRLAEALSDVGAVAEPALAARLGIAIGQSFELGDARLVLRALLVEEPDRLGGFVSIGPRVLIGPAALAGSRIVQPGSIVDYEYRMLLPPGTPAASLAASVRERYPDASFRVRTAGEVEPSLTRITERMASFLALAGLTTLLVGGLGIGLAAETYLAGKTATMATLKCLGATGRQIVLAYLVQIMAVAAAGIALGLLLGAILPLALAELPRALLPVAVEPTLSAAPLLAAGAAGLLTALAFSLWPLGLACAVRPAGLFRALVQPPRQRPAARYVVAMLATVGTLVALTATAVADARAALWFAAAVAGGSLLLVTSAIALQAALRRSSRGVPLAFRLATRNLSRPGVGTISVTVALGAGVAVLTMVLCLQGLLGREIGRQLPDRAPTTVFIDLQPQQAEPFRALVAAEAGARLRDLAPHLRARIVALNGVPVDRATVEPDVRWTLNRDRGLTWRRDPPATGPLADGSWWPQGYEGPPLLSLGANFARGYHLGVGDTIGLNLLGRTIEARIANLRQDIDFASGNLEFFFIMSPGLIERAPSTSVAIVEATPKAESRLIEVVGRALPNVTAISVGPVLAKLAAVLDRVGLGVRVVGAVVLATGGLVLISALVSARRRQRRQTVLFKVLGATRFDVLRILLAESLVIGACAVTSGSALGIVAAYLVNALALDLPWHVPAGPLILLATGTLVATIAVSVVAAWRLLGTSPARLLRAA